MKCAKQKNGCHDPWKHTPPRLPAIAYKAQIGPVVY